MDTLWQRASAGAGPTEVGKALMDQQFPVFLTQHGPAIWPVTNPTAGPPVIVVSVPKSGTYFTEALYKRMGYQGVYVHAMDMECNAWRFHEVTATKDFAPSGMKPIPITILSRLVLPGQIIVSHCGRNPEIAAALSGFKKIYLYRDLREVLVSHARANISEPIPPEHLATRVAEFCESSGNALKNVIETVNRWRNDSEVFAVAFADLTSPDPDRQERLAARFEGFMGWPKAAVIAALRAVPDDETPTRSEGGRSTLDGGAWDERCEAWFSEHMADVRVAPDAVLPD